MWSGAHDSCARGPGFDSHPDPDGIYGKTQISLVSDNRLKTNLFICNIGLSS